MEAGFDVELLVRHRNSNIERLLGAGAHFTAVDYADRATYRRHMEWTDVLFHVASGNHNEAGQSEVEAAWESSITEQVLNAAVAAGVPRIVYTSTAEVLGRNTDAQRQLSEENRAKPEDSGWIQAKIATESFCHRLMQDHSVDLRRVYPACLAGGSDLRGTAPQRLIRAFLQGKVRTFSKGGISVTSVLEAARAHVAAAIIEERGGSWVLGGENITIEQLYRLLAEISKVREPRWAIPATVARVSDEFRTRLGTRKSFEADLPGLYRWYDSSKAIRELGYAIVPARQVLEQGVLFERQRAAGTNVLFRRNKGSERRNESWQQTGPIAVFGAPGWIANRFLDVLLNGDRRGFRYAPREVRVMVQPRHRTLFELPEPFHVIATSAKRPAEVRAALHNAGAVVDLVDPERVTAERTRRLIEHCRAAGVRRLICLVTGTNEAEQVEAERLVLEATAAGEIDGTVLRTYWLCGPFAPARHEKLLRLWQRGRQIVPGEGEARRTITHVDNAVAAVLAAERSSQSIGRSYAVGESDASVDQVRRTLCEAAGQAYEPIRFPDACCGAARALEGGFGKLQRESPATVRAWARADIDFVAGETARAEEFGYQPVITFAEYAQELSRRGRPVTASRKAFASP